jgi:uncharacterized protein (UPF0335 family)
MVGTPKKEPKIDPLAHVQVRAREGEGVMPALSAPPVPMIGHNGDAEEMLDSAIGRLDRLDKEIAALNKAKSEVYSELAEAGFDKPTVRWLTKDMRIDPIIRADRDARRAAYAEAIRRRRVGGGSDREAGE